MGNAKSGLIFLIYATVLFGLLAWWSLGSSGVFGAFDLSDSAALETTVDERGRYAFPETGFVGPALLTVSGFWFDEAEGQFSGEPVTLSAVVFLEEGEQAADANVNVLTDLISERLMAELAEHNDDYAAALAALMPDKEPMDMSKYLQCPMPGLVVGQVNPQVITKMQLRY